VEFYTPMDYRPIEWLDNLVYGPGNSPKAVDKKKANNLVGGFLSASLKESKDENTV
jgi:hypothetical protein